jgi:hypothetical protein
MMPITGMFPTVDQQRPARRMNDMGPRRGMDGFGPSSGQRPAGQPQRPAGQRPAPQPDPRQRPVQPAPMPVRRPVAPTGQRPAHAAQGRVPAQRGYQQPRPDQQYDEQEQYEQPQPKRMGRKQKAPGGGSGTWRVVLQFLIGLAVIAGVAAAIVALYIKYYQ